MLVTLGQGWSSFLSARGKYEEQVERRVVDTGEKAVLEIIHDEAKQRRRPFSSYSKINPKGNRTTTDGPTYNINNTLGISDWCSGVEHKFNSPVKCARTCYLKD